jgi:pilus assembly protein CpaB
VATEVKQRNNRVLVILGVVLAVAAGALTLVVAQRNSNGSGSSSAPTVNAVYAQVAIPKGTKITQDMVQVKQVPTDLVSAATPSDPTAVVNKYAAVDITVGSQLSTSFLVVDLASANQASLAIQPLTIKDGWVAMAIPSSWPGGDAARSADLFSVGGLIQADDHIDMLVDPKVDGSVRFGFQDIHVLRGGTVGANGQASTPAVYIIEVPRAQAEQIAFAFSLKSSTGVVKYVLRPRDQYGKGYLGIDTSGGQEAVPNVNDPVTPQTFNTLFPTH